VISEVLAVRRAVKHGDSALHYIFGDPYNAVQVLYIYIYVYPYECKRRLPFELNHIPIDVFCSVVVLSYDFLSPRLYYFCFFLVCCWTFKPFSLRSTYIVHAAPQLIVVLGGHRDSSLQFVPVL